MSELDCLGGDLEPDSERGQEQHRLTGVSVDLFSPCQRHWGLTEATVGEDAAAPLSYCPLDEVGLVVEQVRRQVDGLESTRVGQLRARREEL